MKKTIDDLKLKNKKVLLRADFNVPLVGDKIGDDTRITEELPTIDKILSAGASVIVCSHLGRPEGEKNLKYSLRPVYLYLKNIYKDRVFFAEDCMGKETAKQAKALKPSQILLLENLRFYKEEEENDVKFAKKLASYADLYVNDAFGTAHRKHASTYGVAKYLHNAVGLLIQKELDMIGGNITDPKRPLVAILGGAKVKDKIKVIKNLLTSADTILLGGGLAYTFLKAQGISVGNSLVDNESLDFAKEMINLAKDNNKKLILPVDIMCAKGLDAKFNPEVIEGNLPKTKAGFDIGPKTVKLFTSEIKKAGTIVWNGPLGVYEDERYSVGTNMIAKAIAKSDAISIIGGGDVVSAISKLKLKDKITHISTGGGASLKLLEGSELPAVSIIEEKK